VVEVVVGGVVVVVVVVVVVLGTGAVLVVVEGLTAGCAGDELHAAPNTARGTSSPAAIAPRRPGARRRAVVG